MGEDTKRLFDMGAWGFAIVAGISLAQAAIFATLLAALASFVLAAIRIHDRIKYGPCGDD
jgi:hypothetical protein